MPSYQSITIEWLRPEVKSEILADLGLFNEFTTNTVLTDTSHDNLFLYFCFLFIIKLEGDNYFLVDTDRVAAGNGKVYPTARDIVDLHFAAAMAGWYDDLVAAGQFCRFSVMSAKVKGYQEGMSAITANFESVSAVAEF